MIKRKIGEGLMKKMAAIIMGVTITALSVVGCGNTGNTESTETSGKEKVENQEEVELTLWHSFDSGASGPIISDFIAKYESENPHVKIVEETAQIEEYQFRKLKVAVSNNSQGDIFLSYGGGYSQSIVDAGAALPLGSYLEADQTYDRMQDGVLEYFTYGNEVYGLPIKKWAGVLFCNKELFSQYNLEYPETWEELMNCVKVFRENKVTPMALGGKDGWHIGMYQNALAVRTGGADYSNEALVGKQSLDTPAIEQSAKLMKELANAGAFAEGVMALSADEAQMEFFMGKVPMYFSGSWTAADVESDENLIKGKIDVVPMPVVEGGKGDATQFLGGAIDCYMVNSKTKYPEEAVKFAIALTEYQSNEGYKIGDGVTAWKSDIDEGEVNPVLVKINKLTEGATGYVLAWDTFLQGTAIDAHYNLLQELIGGSLTPKDFAFKMQEENERAMTQAAASTE